jgi:quinol monooxygenase YgiN
MTSSNVIVVANVYGRSDQIENLLSILRKLTEATRTEPGCIKYDLHQDLSDETHFTFIEQWANEEALQLHFQTEHFKQASEDVKTVIAKPVEIFKHKKFV